MKSRVRYSIRQRPMRFGYVRVRVVRVEGKRETQLSRSRLHIGNVPEREAIFKIARWGLPIIRTDQRRRGVLRD